MREPRKIDPLPVGHSCRARRANGDVVAAQIISAPIEYLLPFGEFYLLGALPPGPEPHRAKHGPKSRARIAWEQKRVEMGMYERSQLLPCPDN